MRIKNLSRYLFALLVFAFLIVVLRRFGELSEIGQIIRAGIWYYLLIALFFQCQVIANQVLVFESLYGYLGAHDRFRRLLKVYLAAIFVNTAAPTYGLSGVALFVKEAEREGLSRSRALIVNALYYFLMNYGTALVVIGFAISFLFYRHQLETYQALSAGILAAIVGVAVLILWIFLGSIVRFRRVLIFVSNIVNRISNIWQEKKLIAPVHIRNLSDELSLLAHSYRRYPAGIWVPFGFNLLARIAEVATLYFVFRAFGTAVPLGSLVAGYGIGVLFTIVSITPGGLGIMEGAMIVAFASLGISVESAAVATLAWRLYSFWLPTIVGFFMLRRLQQEVK